MRLDKPGSEDITAAIDAVADAANADESTLFAISAGRRLIAGEQAGPLDQADEDQAFIDAITVDAEYDA